VWIHGAHAPAGAHEAEGGPHAYSVLPRSGGERNQAIWSLL
jgi:hypothetical protein